VPQVVIDFSEVSSTFDPLPSGEYAVVVDKVELRESQSSDNPYLNWEFSVTEEGEFKDRKLWFITSFAPKALFRMKETFESLGVYQDSMQFEIDDDTNELRSPEVVGLPGRAVVAVEPYQGQDRNKVVNILPAEGAAPTGRSKASGGKTVR
jgi:hypothetical protein